MMKFLPLKKFSGYTLLEIVVSLFILIILFSATQAAYREFILKKDLDNAKGQVMSDLRLAQEYATAGRLTDSCLGLNGYEFVSSSSNQNYRIRSNCGSGSSDVKTVEMSDISNGISINSQSVIFKVLGGGTNISADSSVQFVLTQRTTNNTRSVIVTSGGEIK